MTEVRFYHLTRASLEPALPQMLEKTLARGERAVVMLGSADRVEALNSWLWTSNDRGFLPHGSAKDGFAERQPVWLTAEDEAPNGARYLFLCDGATTTHLENFTLCALLFDGGDEAAVTAARAKWRELKAAGHALTYWQQDEKGGWSKLSDAGVG
jgi:DNA polymerase-3 subunit chi